MKLATFALCAAGAFCLMALPLPSCARPLPAASSPDEIPEPEAMAGGGVSDLSSRNAPTKIASRDLIRFSCQFNALPSPSVPCRDGSIRISVHSGEPAGRYSVELEKTAQGTRFRVACADWQSGRETHRAEGDAPASALAGLQRILEEHDTASLNGYYKRNTALGEGFRLDVRYASGESIAAGAEGGASVMPARGLPLEAFRRFFLELAAKAGKPLYNDKPLQGGISFLQYEFLLAGTPPVPAFSSLPAGIVRLAISRENKAKARVYAGWSNPAESRKRNALVWTTIFEAEVPAVWLDRLQDCFGKHQLARLNGYRHCEGTGVPGMHFDPTLRAAVRMIGDWESGESYEVLAYGREGSLPARDYLDDSWMPAFFAQLAKENGLSLTLTHEP